MGDDIYQKLIKGYTEKQWGRDCKDLPPFILKRVPLRFTYDNNYFTDPHQGIPLEGYDALVERLLTGSDVLLSTPYEEFIARPPGRRLENRVHRHHRRVLPLLLRPPGIPFPPL